MKIITGNLLAQTSGILVHGCNCQGAMGGGIAEPLRKLYPSVYAAYKTLQRTQGLKLGHAQFVTSPGARKPEVSRHFDPAVMGNDIPTGLVVVNAMTQEFYGKDKATVYVDYDAVFSAFARVRLLARDMQAPVRFPMLGAGLANGDWNIVVEAIAAGLRDQFESSELWVLPGAAGPTKLAAQAELEGV